IHYTHKETLGHTTRIIAIAHALIENYGDKISLHILQGGIPQAYVNFPAEAHVINIPHPFDSRASFKRITGTRHNSERAQFILAQARRIIPDIFITEFFPFGRIDYLPELLPTLKYLFQKHSHIYASIGYPYLQSLSSVQEKRDNKILNKLLPFYNKLLIHTPPELENSYFLESLPSPELQEKYQNFFASIKHKTIYTGYVTPHDALQPTISIPVSTSKNPQHTVIVSRGGGTVYPKIILNAIQAQAILGDHYRFIIACGPASSSQEQALFLSFHKKYNTRHVFLFNHIPSLGTLFKDCDASISLCGYNTSVQLMQAGTPAIMIPYHHPQARISTNDQIARSLLMKCHFQSTIIPYINLSPKTLAKAVEEKCRLPRPKTAPAAWFCGGKATADILIQDSENPYIRDNVLKLLRKP
ncbi:MAG: glycosyltransferase, partial [Candidatus Omnitrophota bacterium]